MGFYEISRQERIYGQVEDKYQLPNGNYGLIIQDDEGMKYAVEFRTQDRERGKDNLFGFIKEPYLGRGPSLDKLVDRGDRVGVLVGYNRQPVKTAHHLYQVYREPSGPGSSYGRTSQGRNY